MSKHHRRHKPKRRSRFVKTQQWSIAKAQHAFSSIKYKNYWTIAVTFFFPFIGGGFWWIKRKGLAIFHLIVTWILLLAIQSNSFSIGAYVFYLIIMCVVNYQVLKPTLTPPKKPRPPKSESTPTLSSPKTIDSPPISPSPKEDHPPITVSASSTLKEDTPHEGINLEGTIISIYNRSGVHRYQRFLIGYLKHGSETSRVKMYWPIMKQVYIGTQLSIKGGNLRYYKGKPYIDTINAKVEFI